MRIDPDRPGWWKCLTGDAPLGLVVWARAQTAVLAGLLLGVLIGSVR